MSSVKYIALAPFLKGCPSVRSLGIRPSMGDYTEEERERMRSADRILFPTQRFVLVFKAIGKPTFPSPASYLVRRSRLHQQVFFKVLGIPHGKTRIYYGARQKRRMMEDFHLPVDVLAPEATPASVHRVLDWERARAVAERYNPVIVRQAVPLRDCIRLTSVRFACVWATRGRIQGAQFIPHEFLSTRDPFIATPVSDTETLTRHAGIDDIAVDWGLSDEGWHVLQLARPPLRLGIPGPSLSRHDHIAALIAEGRF